MSTKKSTSTPGAAQIPRQPSTPAAITVLVDNETPPVQGPQEPVQIEGIPTPADEAPLEVSKYGIDSILIFLGT